VSTHRAYALACQQRFGLRPRFQLFGSGLTRLAGGIAV
ncbi:hypothetical protein AVDCRST_MAG82-3585, partial [uncultured Rubrobacteraceae bacterium]